jgi:hypothetical protein
LFAPLGHPGLPMPLPPPVVGAVYPKNGIWFLANRFPPVPHNHIPRLFDSAWWSRRRVSVRNSSDSRFNVPSPCYMRYGGRKQLAAVCSLGCCAYLFAGPTRRILPGLPPNPPGFSSWNPAHPRGLWLRAVCLFADATKSCTHQCAASAAAGFQAPNPRLLIIACVIFLLLPCGLPCRNGRSPRPRAGVLRPISRGEGLCRRFLSG